MVHQWLSKPFPFINEVRFNLLLSAGLSLIAFLVLYLARPFGLDIVDGVTYFIGFGVSSFIGLVFHLLVLPLLFPKVFNNDTWTIKKHLIFLISLLSLISLLNYLYNTTVGSEISPQYSFLTFLLMTSSVGALPSLLLTYIFEKYQSTKNEKAASAILLPLEKKIENTVVIVPETNQHEQLNILTSAFLYAEADKNYCYIYYLYQGAVQKQMMRLRLKNLLEQVAEKPQFLRVHKSYVINKENIVEVSGNARSLLLKIKAVEETIPVSRSFDKALLM